jgi:hypothetical protein
MLPAFPTFAIFPHGLESNLLVPVLLGVLVNFALTEAWGWDFVGVVVPGYLSAVALVEPVVAGVVLVEATLTWAMARLLDAGATRAGLWYPVFGRDRFYFLLVVSIFARLIVEGAAPALLAFGALAWPRLADFRGETFGIGLVLVPLAANRFWRAGLASGLFQLGIEVGVVRLLLAGLILVTNYSLSGFELGFDRVALAFFASPLTQLALLLTAAIASHFNRRFGWDSHGILVPALLALVVTAPLKVAATLAEAIAIVVAMTALVRLPWLRRANLEGARRVVACFVVGAFIKVLVATVMGRAAPGYRVTELFGFGYLLPSLLAERVLARSNLPLVLVPTAQTAMLGMPLAAVMGLLIAWLSPVTSPPRAAEDRQHYATLAQAVAAHAVVGRAHAGNDVAALVGRLARGAVTADTGDGYVLAADPAVRGLVARPARGGQGAALEVIVVAPGDEELADVAARDAAHSGASLVVAAPGTTTEIALAALGGTPTTARAARDDGSAASIGSLEVPLRAALEEAAPVTPYRAPPPAAALEEAAFRITRDRADPRTLARTLRPLMLGISRTIEGAWLLEGPGWPTIVLGGAESGAAHVVVVAPHAGELGTGAVALLASARLAGDAVIARGDVAPRAASALAVALARASTGRLLIVRGTTFSAGGDVLLLGEPAPAGAWPSWTKDLSRALVPRFAPARVTSQEAAVLRAFPAGTARLEGAALLWLSPRARRALPAGDAPFARPEYVALAAARGVSIVHARLETWLGTARGGPGTEAVARAERLARSGDPAMLAARFQGARAVVFVDDARALSGIGVSSDLGRAVALGGDRGEERAVVRSPGDLVAALERGARTLVAGAGP